MARPIMLQGTMSNVGKSFLTAALCRIFRQDGHAPAPFKSQNMALNSFITADGLEMGRAQAMQAQAAGIKPTALMNPVLLKPTTDVGSQVIVGGEVWQNMTARDYFARKTELFPAIDRAYQTLSAQHDILVIEGAGSPVELNLKRDDIVNMGLAKRVKSPVLLVGDIDRGGIFAQLLGTLSLLEPEERALVRGLIVNNFRGDVRLFSDGIRILEKRGGVPVLGVVPHITADIEDEDSLSEKLGVKGNTGLIDIAVIRLPRISNFTDLDVFSQYDGVSVRYVSRYEELGMPDLIILPGTKSTLSDLRWLRTSGLEAAILRRKDTPVFGICGGYQMLGECIRDPENTEGGGELRGLGLLPGETVFTPEKRRAQVSGRLPEITDGFWKCLSCADYEGYEVHMGRTPGGVLNVRDNAAGSYVHGIFDTAAVSGALVRALFARKGITWDGAAADRSTYREQQFDLLASGVRKALDMDKIYRILEEGV